jgi:hypothetical protein
LLTINNSPYSLPDFSEICSQILNQGLTLRFRASGTSMQPLIRDGDFLLVQPRKTSPVHLGDVVLCSLYPGRIVVHRVIRRFTSPNGWKYTVQGDQILHPDGLVPEAQIHGKVFAIERDGKILYLDHPLMRALGILALLRSRWRIDHQSFRTISQVIKRLPYFYRYLT